MTKTKITNDNKISTVPFCRRYTKLRIPWWLLIDVSAQSQMRKLVCTFNTVRITGGKMKL